MSLFVWHCNNQNNLWISAISQHVSNLVSWIKRSIFSCDLRSPGWPKGMMGGAAGVEVRHIRGPHFRLAFVTVSGNISNLYQKKFNFKPNLMTVGVQIPNVFGIQMVECVRIMVPTLMSLTFWVSGHKNGFENIFLCCLHLLIFKFHSSLCMLPVSLVPCTT